MSKAILVVDDSSVMRMTIESVLKESGYIVLQADNGQAALDVLAQNRVDLIVSDVNMPIMDGLTLAQNVKKIDSYKFIPIIMLTTVSAQDQMQVGREAGVKAWIVKPFEPKKLSGAVAKLLGI